MLEPADLLLLDEPTNDLDIAILEILEESLLEYTGALILITHDRYMLDRVSTVVLGLAGPNSPTKPEHNPVRKPARCHRFAPAKSVVYSRALHKMTTTAHASKKPRSDANQARTENTQRVRGSVVDLFCGAGGLTHGLKAEGFAIAVGIDVDEECRYAFEQNNGAPFVRMDVSSLDSTELTSHFYADQPRILVGCAPCQPFSTYNQKSNDPKWRLVDKFADIICGSLPDVVSMENVPRLRDFQKGRTFKSFVENLKKAGYSVSHDVIFLPEFGIPQTRSRLVLLASLHGHIDLPVPTVSEENFRTVSQTIGMLPPIMAGQIDEKDILHQSSRLADINLRRIKASVPGGSWKDWEPELVANCHKAEQGVTYRSVYGRMRADRPAPTITTQFFGFGNGRFGHPVQDRGLSLREGALLQTFPQDYVFSRPGEVVKFKNVGRMIGNAVPVDLGRAIGRAIKAHIQEVGL